MFTRDDIRSPLRLSSMTDQRELVSPNIADERGAKIVQVVPGFFELDSEVAGEFIRLQLQSRHGTGETMRHLA